jgi:hypothetical protein
MKKPDQITLSLCNRGNGPDTEAIYFFGLYAASYYREVISSQSESRIVACKVLSGPEDTSIWSKERTKLRATEDPNVQRAILKSVSERWEKICGESDLGRGKPQFSGDLLLPKMSYQDALPPGAREGAPQRP